VSSGAHSGRRWWLAGTLRTAGPGASIGEPYKQRCKNHGKAGAQQKRTIELAATLWIYTLFHAYLDAGEKSGRAAAESDGSIVTQLGGFYSLQNFGGSIPTKEAAMRLQRP
jgi:hypothetical protein